MTNNTKETKFTLVTKEGRQLVRAKLTGEPFEYTSKALAQMGKRHLENDRKVALIVVPA